MSGPVYGQHFSVRIPDEEARKFDEMATLSGLRRSELLRLVILKAVSSGFCPSISGADLHLARTIGAPRADVGAA